MSDNLKKVISGQPLRMPAEAYNAFVDAAIAHKRGQINDGLGENQARTKEHWSWVRNHTGADRDQYHVVEISDPLVLPADDAELFLQSNTVFKGITPSGTAGKVIGILQGPAPHETNDADKGITKALIFGLSWVQIDVTDAAHTFADPTASDCTKLTSKSSGQFPIIWKESGTGTKWAVVALGVGSGGGGGAVTAQLFASRPRRKTAPVICPVSCKCTTRRPTRFPTARRYGSRI